MCKKVFNCLSQFFQSLLHFSNHPKERSTFHFWGITSKVWIEIGNLFILLGSDLEETSDPQTGWSVIVGSITSV